MTKKISTRNLSGLPEPERLEALTRSLAMLEVIMSPDWKYRYFQFDRLWDAGKNQRLASLDTGSGDSYFLVFSPLGVFLKGFDHEAIMTPWAFDPLQVWKGILDEVPSEFAPFLNEPAFDMESTTFCIWRRPQDTTWQIGKIDFPEDIDPDGSEDLLWMLDDNPETYVQFANEYYETTILLTDVESIYSGHPITSEITLRINPNADWKAVEEEAHALQYPSLNLSK